MRKRDLADHSLESLRRSLAMLQTNQLALTRDQSVDLVTELLDARRQVRQLDAQLADQVTRAPDDDARPDGPRRA